MLSTVSSLSPGLSVAVSISQALDLLALSDQEAVKEAILTSCNKVLESGKDAVSGIQFLVKLLLQSPRLCSLVAGDVLKLGRQTCVGGVLGSWSSITDLFSSVTVEAVHSLVMAEVERSAAEDSDDQGELVSEHGDHEEQASTTEVDQDADRCVCQCDRGEAGSVLLSQSALTVLISDPETSRKGCCTGREYHH